MIKKVISFIFGICICSYNMMLIIIYLNLLKMNYSFLDYLIYVVKYIIFFIVGVIFIIISFKLRIKKYN